MEQKIKGFEPPPSCHPINEYSVFVPADSCFTALFMLLIGKKEVKIGRSGEKIWMGRTDKENVFSCPRKIAGRCNFVYPCIPENETIKVINSGDNLAKEKLIF